MSLKLSPVTKAQWAKVAKAVIYAYVSSFFVVWSTTGYNLSKGALVASATAGLNGIFVLVKQLFTQPVLPAQDAYATTSSTPTAP